MNPKTALARAIKRLDGTFGRGQTITFAVAVFLALCVTAAMLIYAHLETPNTITIASGPKGSSFERNALKYQKILAREGVKLKILPSGGSMDNYRMLLNPKVAVDIGFVLGGEVSDAVADSTSLVSLGSMSYQPLMVFYRGKPKSLLSDFKGLRLDIGQEGSGSHALSLALLKVNGIEPGGDTRLLTSVKGDLVRALLENRVDAIFVTGDSTSVDMMRELMHAEEVRMFNFTQADAYTRRINYLSKLELPKGSLDFGKNMPSEDLSLVAPTVEIIARDGLHPALMDALLEAAREVHGTGGLFKKRGEFPNAQEHEFRISPDAIRYYTSGKSFLYRSFPFAVASLITRALAVIVPLLLLLIPAFKVVPAIYRWRMESRIHRWYRALLDLERDAFASEVNDQKRIDLLRHLDHIEHTVSKIVVPAAFGDLFYGLRGHICFVRNILQAHQAQVTQQQVPAPE
ncbi:MAG: TAXI family TRAP transporter solute-binding subunit [Pseudomonadota bacterium]